MSTIDTPRDAAEDQELENEEEEDYPESAWRQIVVLFEGAPAALTEAATFLSAKAAQALARAVRAAGQTVASAVRGSVIIATQLATWTGEELPFRLIPWAIVGAAYWWIPPLRHGAALYVVVGGWCLSAIGADRAARKGEPTTEIPAAPAPDPRVDDEAVRLAVEHAVAVAVRDGRRGIHLDDLLKQLHRAALLRDHDTNALRERLAALGITVRDQLKIGKRNVRGVHADDLAADLGHMLRLPAHLVPDNTHNPPAGGEAPSGDPSPAPLADAG